MLRKAVEMGEKEIELLKSLDLSEDAAKIYVFLVKNPEEYLFEEISPLCKMPPGKVHVALEELLERKLAKVESNKFSAIQPKLALSSWLEQKEKELEMKIDKFRSSVLSLQKTLEPLFWEIRAGIRPEELIEPLESTSTMEVRTARIIGNAGKEVIILAGRFDWYDKIKEVLLQALDRGAKVRVLMHIIDKTTIKRAKELKELGVQVRQPTEESLVRGTLVDERELVLLIWVRKDVARPAYFRPFYTNNIGLVKAFSDAFKFRWEKAKEIKFR